MAPPASVSAHATGAATLTAAAGAVAAPAQEAAQPAWPSAGQNNDDTHNAAVEHILSVGNVSQLAPKWTFTTAGNVSATATVAGGTVYVPDWGGKLWAVSAATGQALWSRTITSYDGIPGDVSRTSPAYYDGELVIGTGANTLSNLQGERGHRPSAVQAYQAGYSPASARAQHGHWFALLDDLDLLSCRKARRRSPPTASFTPATSPRSLLTSPIAQDSPATSCPTCCGHGSAPTRASPARCSTSSWCAASRTGRCGPHPRPPALASPPGRAA